MTMHLLVGDPEPMIAASVQCDVDGIPEGSHDVVVEGIRKKRRKERGAILRNPTAAAWPA